MPVPAQRLVVAVAGDTMPVPVQRLGVAVAADMMPVPILARQLDMAVVANRARVPALGFALGAPQPGHSLKWLVVQRPDTRPQLGAQPVEKSTSEPAGWLKKTLGQS